MKVITSISRVTKTLLFALGFLILLAFTLPLIFKNKLVNLAKQAINDNLKATVDFQDPSLTLLSSFPYVRLELDKVLIIGQDTFASDTLLYSEEMSLSANLSVFWNKTQPVTLRRIKLVQPKLFLKTLENGNTNYDIVKEDETSQNAAPSGTTNFKLDQIIIEDGDVSYSDAQSQMSFNARGINLNSSGDYVQDVINLRNKADIRSLDFQQGPVSYLHGAVVSWQGDLKGDLEHSKYTLEGTQFIINALELTLNGWVQVFEEKIDLDFKFNAPSDDVRQFMSLVPGIYQNQFADLESRGQFSLAGNIFGSYSEQGTYPKFKIESSLQQAWVKYKSMPYALEGMEARLTAESLDDRMENMRIMIPAFNFSLNQRPVSGQVSMLASPQDLAVKGDLKGSTALEDWQKFMPLDSTNLRGLVNMGLDFDFNQSSVLNKHYDRIKFSGDVTAQDVHLQQSGFPQLTFNTLTAKGDAKLVSLNLENAEFGRSKFSAQGQINNILALGIGAWSSSFMDLNLLAEHLDLDEFIEGSNSTASTMDTLTTVSTIPEQINLHFKGKVNQVVYAGYDLKNINLEGNYKGDTLQIKQFSGQVNQSNLSAHGLLGDVYAWSNDQGVLKGKLYLSSAEFKVDPWMVPSDSTTASGTAASRTILPANTELNITANLGKVVYDTYTLSQVQGDIQLVEQVLEMHDVKAKGFGGDLNLEGVFDDSGTQPKFNFKYELQKLAIAKLFQSSPLFRKLAPIAEFLEGTLSSSMVMSGQLDQAMNPVWDEFDAAGLLETFNGLISKFGPLEKAAKEFKFPSLNLVKWEKSKNWFTVEKGAVTINPFPIHYQGLEMIISGQHQIDQDIAYQALFKFPRQLLQKNNLTAQFNSGITWLTSQVKQKGLDIGTLDTIFINMALTGNIKDPQVKFTWAGDLSGKPIEQQITDELKAVVEEKKDTLIEDVKKETTKIKDSVVTIIDKKTDEAVDVISEKAKEAVDTAGKIIGSKAKEIIDSTLVDKLGKAVDSTARSKIDTLLGKKGKEEVDKIKDQIKNWDPFKKKKKENGGN